MPPIYTGASGSLEQYFPVYVVGVLFHDYTETDTNLLWHRRRAECASFSSSTKLEFRSSLDQLFELKKNNEGYFFFPALTGGERLSFPAACDSGLR